MVSGETVVKWSALLNRQARAFRDRRSPERARDILMLCACVESAVTAYLIKQKMEDMINDDGSK
jgi:hypothetical protein